MKWATQYLSTSIVTYVDAQCVWCALVSSEEAWKSHGKVHSPMTADTIKRTSRLELRFLFLLELPMQQSDITDWHRNEMNKLRRARQFEDVV